MVQYEALPPKCRHLGAAITPRPPGNSKPGFRDSARFSEILINMWHFASSLTYYICTVFACLAPATVRKCHFSLVQTHAESRVKNAVSRVISRQKMRRKCTLSRLANRPKTRPEDWCGREDSNLHEFPRYHLKVVRLPIPPRPHAVLLKREA